MKLLYAPTSPFVRKVMVCAHLTGQLDRIELLPSAAHPIRRDPRIAAHNPLAKVPTLILDDGQALYDSRVICEYLADLAADGAIFPVVSPARWTALSRQALGDGLLDAALLARYELTARPVDKQWTDWRAALLTKVTASVAAIEAIAPSLTVHAPSIGDVTDTPNIGEITIGCALGYLDFRFPELDWRAECPHAAAWNERFQCLPALLATRPHEG